MAQKKKTYYTLAYALGTIYGIVIEYYLPSKDLTSLIFQVITFVGVGYILHKYGENAQ